MFHEYDDDDDDDEQTPVIGGTDMTLHELQRMAAIQQQQIDKQQQMLVAKEQRLKFLKQQDLKQQQMHAENERLYQLREKVKAQELKLKKLRALRGQVDEKKVNNASLTCELESIKALFNEKEKELSMAVSKVEELKKQLDDLRHHNQNQNPVNEKMIELEKLKNELCIRNKLNEQQNIRLTERREMLSKRQNDISAMDQRIIELQQRLQKKRQLQQQHQQMLKQNISAPVNMSSNVATVEPFKQGPINSFQIGNLNKNDGTDPITNKALKDKINEGSLNIYAMDQNKSSPTDGEANMSRKAYLVKQPSSGRQPYSSLVAPKGWGSSSSSKSSGVNEKNVSKSFPVYSVPSVDTDLSSIIPSRPSPAGSGDSNTSSKIDNPWKGDPIEVQQSPDSQINTPITSASDSQKLRFAPKMITNNAHTRRLGSAAMSSYNKAMSQLYESFPSKVPEPKDQTKLPGKLPGSPTAKVQPLRIEESTDFSSETSDKYEDYPTPEFHPGGTINADKFSVKTNTLRNIRRRHSSTDSEELNKVLQARFKITEKATSQGTISDNSNETGDKNEPLALSVIDKPKRPSAPVILRKKNLAKSTDRLSSRRVSFDPHALLLDASLEGELDLVKKTVGEVTDPSLPNDEGITALHNAICAGHIEIVKFLVEFGCDVNAADSDGWTPLHCAASCNNLEMVKFLVEHGACIFAMTISDQETAAEKCEEDEDGFDGCSEYLYSIQEKIGILNGGAVYGLYSYHSPNNDDELVFDINDRMIVLRKVDATEKEWWWAKLKDKEGFIPRNLIGLFPRLVHQLIPS